MISKRNIRTAADLLEEAPQLGRCELLRGELMMMSPSGFEHGKLVARVTLALASFVEREQLGVVTGAETGFLLERDPDTVRAPDVAFVQRSRVPQGRHRGYFDGPPDLAVEIVSPNDRSAQVDEKSRQWIGAGCQAVWVVDPETQSITVYRRGEDIAQLRVGDVLVDSALLPGFSLSLADIFRAM